ncbi:hypothetical protein VTN77DRAFT_5666 [Rasamsonia byssochlamydoides]|uniref:uncharacterized protein n=1 Tax=Rasamsonia byssochlamydoides TaxID=89139 RepID=UPI003741E9D1
MHLSKSLILAFLGLAGSVAVIAAPTGDDYPSLGGAFKRDGEDSGPITHPGDAFKRDRCSGLVWSGFPLRKRNTRRLID